MSNKTRNDIIKAILLSIVFVFATPELVLAAGKAKAPASKAGQIKTIPKLSIKEERPVALPALDVKLPPNRELKILQVKAKPSPQVAKLPTMAVAPADAAKKLIDVKNAGRVPVVKQLDFISEPSLVETEPQLQNLIEIKPDEYKLLQALIFMEYQKKHDLAMSLFVELMDSKDYRTHALYHYAQTALALGLNSEFRQKMLQVTQETKDQTFKKMAVEQLAQNVAVLENTDIGVVDPLVQSFEIDVLTNEKYLLKKAKYYSDKGDLSQLENTLMYISEKSQLYPEASVLKAAFNYRRGQLDAAISELEYSWPKIKDRKKDHIRNLAALTLARLYFQKSDYKAAYKMYVEIDKGSPSWLQAMVEQAWTQILAGDYEGAAGNMFSMHTDFFKKAYAPESYIVRTVGYLNLCQYGDGVNVLGSLKKRYAGVRERLDSFQKAGKDPERYYELIKTWMNNTNADQVDGLPRAFIVELARHPNFTSVQKQINNYEDENSRFNKLAIDLIRKEGEARLRMLKAKNELAAAKRDGSSPDRLNRKEQEFLAVGVEHLIISRAREGIKKVRSAAIVRLDKEKDALRVKAAKNLQARFNTFAASLGNLVDQNEVLSYEIYSGAGEHIRYQMAGGEAAKRDAAALTPDEKESYKWKFKGEVWEDELGHYRSSLKNVCPADEIAQGSN